MSDVAHAFIESPQYRRGAMFINYDEWGGFFDHVAPAARARRPREPQGPRKRLVDHRLPGPGGGDLALRAGRQEGRAGEPHDLHPRVDPEADLLPLRARPPDQAPPLRLQHRAQLRLLQARLRAARAARPGGDRGDAVLARRQRRSGRRSTTWRSSRPPACSTGSATRSPRSPTTRCFATRTRVRRAFEGRSLEMSLPPGPGRRRSCRPRAGSGGRSTSSTPAGARHGDAFSVKFLGFRRRW